MYLSTCTCPPHILYAVGLVARFTDNPGPKHWVAVKQIFRYLRGNPTLGIVYSKTLAGPVFDAMVDTDHAGDTEDRKSTNMSGAPIVWISKKQQSVSISLTEAEYMAWDSQPALAKPSGSAPFSVNSASPNRTERQFAAIKKARSCLPRTPRTTSAWVREARAIRERDGPHPRSLPGESLKRRAYEPVAEALAAEMW